MEVNQENQQELDKDTQNAEVDNPTEEQDAPEVEAETEETQEAQAPSPESESESDDMGDEIENWDQFSSAEKRIKKVIAQKKDALARAVKAEEQLAQFQARLKEGQNAPTDTDAPQDEYIRAKDLPQVIQQMKQMEALNQYQQKVWDNIQTVEEQLEIAADLDPNFEKLLTQTKIPLTGEFTEALANAVCDPDTGLQPKQMAPFLKHLLIKHADTLKTMGNLSPVQQQVKIMRLAEQYQSRVNARQSSKAPAPLERAKAKAGVGSSDPMTWDGEKFRRYLFGDRYKGTA